MYSYKTCKWSILLLLSLCGFVFSGQNRPDLTDLINSNDNTLRSGHLSENSSELDFMLNEAVNNHLQQSMEEIWSDVDWEKKRLLQYEYDANDNAIEITIKKWDGDQWQVDQKKVYVYNYQNKLIMQSLYTYQPDKDAMALTQQETYQYVPDGRYKEWIIVKFDVDTGELTLGAKYTISYQDGFLVEWKTDYMYAGQTEWQNAFRSLFSMNDENMREELVQEWVNGEYVDLEKHVSELNTFSDPVNKTLFIKQNGEWTNCRHYTYKYNDMARLTEKCVQQWQDNSWTNVDSLNKNYNAQGKCIESTEYLWNDGAWQLAGGTKTECCYDGMACLSNEVCYQFTDNDWKKFQRTSYTYGHTVSVTKDSNVPQTFELSNYPNPFNPQTTISFQLLSPNPVSLRIFNISGQEIKTLFDQDFLSSGLYKYVWNGTDNNGQNMPSGIYIYRLQVANQLLSRQCILLK